MEVETIGAVMVCVTAVIVAAVPCGGAEEAHDAFARIGTEEKRPANRCLRKARQQRLFVGQRVLCPLAIRVIEPLALPAQQINGSLADGPRHCVDFRSCWRPQSPKNRLVRTGLERPHAVGGDHVEVRRERQR